MIVLVFAKSLLVGMRAGLGARLLSFSVRGGWFWCSPFVIFGAWGVFGARLLSFLESGRGAWCLPFVIFGGREVAFVLAFCYFLSVGGDSVLFIIYFF